MTMTMREREIEREDNFKNFFLFLLCSFHTHWFCFPLSTFVYHCLPLFIMTHLCTNFGLALAINQDYKWYTTFLFWTTLYVPLIHINDDLPLRCKVAEVAEVAEVADLSSVKVCVTTLKKFTNLFFIPTCNISHTNTEITFAFYIFHFLVLRNSNTHILN